MPSIFQDQFIAQSFLKYWKVKPFIVNFEGQTSVLGIKEKTIYKNFKFQQLFSLYDSFLNVRSESKVLDILFFLNNLAKQHNINEISIKIGYNVKVLIDSRLPYNFIIKKIDEQAVVDLSIPLPVYLKGLKSGFREYYERGIKRDLYKVDVKGKDLPRADFDLCLERIRESNIDQGHSFKWTEEFKNDVFSFFEQGKAILFSAKAKLFDDVYADLLILHNSTDAFYFSGSRKQGHGVLNGISHFLQIFCIDYLSKNGFLYYSLGFVGQGDDFIDNGVRNFKRSFASNIEPILHFYRADFLTNAISLVKKIKLKV